MLSESGERRPTKPQQGGAPPTEPEHLPCPRCDSSNTKFCYYNNYNSSQPRHFCKTCRRYWTQGGTLRDIPVGGGSRKNAKRSRTITSVATFTQDNRHVIGTAAPLLVPLAAEHGGAVPFVGDAKQPSLNFCGSFTSLLNNQGPGMLALGLGGFGLGLGFGSGFEDLSFGVGRAVWPLPGVGLGDGGATGGGGDNGSVVGNPWQLEGGDGGYGGGDCFPVSDLVISTPGNCMK
ncbi:unnamed protein product [Ilex paraguariensis]|uniref:Dof zinc finger protein n=1 Tax=Ilex paraguariensis TaxID=185542 RepID=A0ABC8UWL4_9AQUA